MALRDHARRGATDALRQFKLEKTAGLLDGASKVLFGEPGRAFIEGPRAFAPGGLLSHQNIWWPSTQGITGVRKALPWMQRASTLAVPLQMMSARNRNPHEGALSNMLGTAGSIAGMAYGIPSLGLLGAPVLSGVASTVGHDVGRLLGSRPKDFSP